MLVWIIEAVITNALIVLAFTKRDTRIGAFAIPCAAIILGLSLDSAIHHFPLGIVIVLVFTALVLVDFVHPAIRQERPVRQRKKR